MKNIAVLASHNGSGLDTIHQAYLDKILDVNIQVVISNNTNAPALEKAILDLSSKMRYLKTIQEDKSPAGTLTERQAMILGLLAMLTWFLFS